MRRTVMAAILTAMLLGTLPAADWPQWGGPKRDGHSAEVGVKAKLTAKGGPKLAWTFKDAGTGAATPALVGERIYVMGCRKDKDKKDVEFVIALDLKGKELWACPLGPVWDFDGNVWSRGPNSTPAVDGDRLYALTSHGLLACVETASGKLVWQQALDGAYGGSVTMAGGGPAVYGWGFSWSPLVDGDRVIATPGGKKGLFAAFDKKTGKQVWRSDAVAEDCTYGSAIVAEIHGVRQYVAPTQSGPVAVDAKTGKLLWFPKLDDPIGDMVCATPIAAGEKVIFSSTKFGTAVYKIEKKGGVLEATPAFKTAKGLANFHGGIVLVDGHVYGAHEERDWKCIDAANGKTKWSTMDPGVGPILALDGTLVLQDQNANEVVVAAADPAEFKELARWKLPEVSKQRKSSAKFWTHPMAAGKLLIVRDQELLFAYEL